MSLLSVSSSTATFASRLDRANLNHAFLTICIALFLSLTLSANSIAKEIGAEGYSVQVGAFRDPSDSTIALATNISAGEVYGYSQANLHKYYIGRYATRTIAEKKLQMIRDRGFPDAFLADYSSNFLPLDSAANANTVALGTSIYSRNASTINKNQGNTQTGSPQPGSSFLMKPTSISTVVNQASVAKIEAALASLSQSDRANVVMMNGRLWLKSGERYTALPLG